MDWTQVLAIVGSNIALILIMFGTVVTMWIHSDKKTEDNRKETTELIKAIQKEMTDFHCRLFELECQNKNREK